MKTSGKFEVVFYGQFEVEMDNYSNSRCELDGTDMFRADSGGRDCFDRAGYIQLDSLSVGKQFVLTVPSGQLAGQILEVRLEERDLRTENGLAGGQMSPMTAVVIQGTWKGALRGLADGQSAVASFRKI